MRGLWGSEESQFDKKSRLFANPVLCLAPNRQIDTHCVKSVQIRSFFWSVFSCIRTEYGDLRNTEKYGPEQTLHWDTFHVVANSDLDE